MSKFEPELWGGSLPAANLTLYSTAGIGTSDYISFKTGSQSERLKIDTNGNVVVGSGALATNATNGFFYIPGSAGTPTGVPTSNSGRVPIDYDTTNNRLYFYNGGWQLVGSAVATASLEYTVEDYGAVGDGVTDDTAAIQAAINAAQSGGGGIVRFGPKGYLFTSTLTISDICVTLEGDGKFSTILSFSPSADDTAIAIADGANIVNWTKLIGFTLYSGDTTYTKIGVQATDVDFFEMNDVCISGNFSGSWGGGTGSIGVQLKGRDFINIRDNCQFHAQKPVVISANPNSYIAFDHSTCAAYLTTPSGFPCITVDDAVYLSNATFSGSWILGTAGGLSHGFYHSDTSGSVAWSNVKFVNVRAENADEPTAYSIYADPVNCNGLHIENVGLAAGCKGIYLRNCTYASISNALYPSATLEALNVDNTVAALHLFNNFWQTGSTATIGAGLNLIYKVPNVPDAGSIPGTAYYSTSTANFTVDTLTANTKLVPDANDGATLGISGTAFSDLFLASGAVVNFAAGDVTLTHSSNALAIAGGTTYSFDANLTLDPQTASSQAMLRLKQTGVEKWAVGKQTDDSFLLFDIVSSTTVISIPSNGTTILLGRNTIPFSNDAAALGASGTAWSDLFLASGAVINFNAGDVTLTHSTDTLTIGGPGTLVLAAGTTAVAPLKFQSGTNLTSAADGAMEFDGQALFFSPDASDRRIIPAVAITRLHAAYTLADSTSLQKIFNASANGALTLPTGSYIFECVVGIDAMSGTSGNAALSIIGAGGATVTNTLQVVVGIDGAKATAGAAAGASWSATNDVPAANTSVVTVQTATELAIMWKGSFEVTGAGTIIPSVDLITGGVTPAVKLGSYFMCWRMGAATDVTQGNWS